MFKLKKDGTIQCDAEVEFKKEISFPKYKLLRFTAMLSLGLNLLLFLCLWILEARVSKIEKKHTMLIH